MKILIVHQDCNPELANNRELPCNAYIVEYNDMDKVCYDIVVSNKQIDIFDYYWDKYREGLKNWKQTEGRVNPKLWNSPSKKKK